jgi:hypothetical protein
MSRLKYKKGIIEFGKELGPPDSFSGDLKVPKKGPLC